MIWVKYKSGVIWGHRGQKVIFSKNAPSATEYMVLSALCNIVYPCYHVTHKYALTWDSELHSLVQGQLGITSADRVCRLWRQHVSSSYPAGGPAGSCILLVSSFFFFFFFFFFFLTLPVTPAGSCFLLVSSFFLLSFFLSFFFLATRLFHILPYIRFWPNLVKVTGTLTTTQAQTMVGSEVTMGSLGSKRSFSSKRHQVLQNT